MIRTPGQYIESLNDGRVTYFLGERIPDVTKQPLLRGSINRASLDWVMANDARYRDLVTEIDEDGERVNFLWRQPRTAEELLRQRDIFVLSCRIGFGIGQNCHAMAKALDFFKQSKTTWEKEIPSAIKCLENSLDSCLTYLQFPEEEWLCLRTTNVIERVNKEFKRRTNPMEILAGERSCYMLLAFVCVKMEVHWRSKPTHKIIDNTI